MIMVSGYPDIKVHESGKYVTKVSGKRVGKVSGK